MSTQARVTLDNLKSVLETAGYSLIIANFF